MIYVIMATPIAVQMIADVIMVADVATPGDYSETTTTAVLFSGF